MPDEPRPSLTDAPVPDRVNLLHIPLDRLEPDPFQPRTVFKESAIRELAQSIEQHGVLQPLLVRPKQGPNSRNRYWIVAGERRLRAAQLLGLETLPCRVQAYENMTAAVIALAENVHRQDLSEIDKAAALLRIKNLTDRTWDEVAELVKLSRDYVKRLAGLLKLEDSVKEKVRAGQIPVRTAIALRPLPPREQVQMLERILDEGLTAEQVREEVLRRRQRRSGGVPAAPKEGEPQARGRTPATIAGHLRDCTETVREIERWLESRDWAPSQVTEGQKTALNELAEAVGLLHQQLLALRAPLRERPTADAERLRREKLPF